MDNKEYLKEIPSVNLLLQSEQGKSLIDRYSHEVVVEAIRESIDRFRQKQVQRAKEYNRLIEADQADQAVKAYKEEKIYKADQVYKADSVEKEGKKDIQEYILNAAQEMIEEKFAPSLKRTINGTGTIIHTNLGRAKLSPATKEALLDAAFSFSNLEYDIHEGSRGSRYQHLEDMLCELTGAQGALVVNNNAAAIMLVLDTMAKGKEVIVSRGELVEIGGSFRVPEIIELSGCKLKEVGTTNKTHKVDYERALGEETGAILKVHCSNYKITGFTESVSINGLSGVLCNHNDVNSDDGAGSDNSEGDDATSNDVHGYSEVNFSVCNNEIPIIYDMGSGMLINLEKYGLPYEMTVKDSLEQGADIVTFSSDKVLGGPQGGIIVGKKKYIDAIKKNQLTRTLRVEKMTIATLEATLRLYYDEQQALKEIPTLKMLVTPLEELEKKAKDLANQLLGLEEKLTVEIIDTTSQVGGGAYPGEEIKSKGVALSSDLLSANQLSERLRKASVPIISKIRNQKCELDVRTLEESEFAQIVHTLTEIIQNEMS